MNIDDPIFIGLFLAYTGVCIAYGATLGRYYEQGRSFEREDSTIATLCQSFFEKMMRGGRNG